MTSSLISPSVRLDANERRLVGEAIEKALLAFGEDDFFYIGERILAKLDILASSPIHWVGQLHLVASAFHLILRDQAEGARELEPEIRRLVGIGLYHLVNPFDVIPDHILGDGYLDDAMVINYCAERIDRHDPKLLATYIRRVKRAGTGPPCR